MSGTKSTSNVLLVGNGNMAEAYAKVLVALEIPFKVIGRNKEKIRTFSEKYNSEGYELIQNLTEAEVAESRFAIITTAMETMADIAEQFLNMNAKWILAEKPPTLSIVKAIEISNLAKQKKATLRVALNRRFYTSVMELKNRLLNEPAVCGFFDFTENFKAISEAPFHTEAKQKWAWANSVHILDTVKYILGQPSQIKAQQFGKNDLPMHSNASTFLGTIMFGNVPTSYETSWVCPGRWNIEVMTKQGRYKLSPMEKLQMMEPGKFQWNELNLDYDLDVRFKPGVYRMVQSFDAMTKGAEDQAFPDYFAHVETMKYIAEIVGY